ncbi:hypothetical protein chiPu_0026438, partial [Chiloscyllium punctatum]|nr:hypothetical protein [Chiloscyllium punctatum]
MGVDLPSILDVKNTPYLQNRSCVRNHSAAKRLKHAHYGPVRGYAQSPPKQNGWLSGRRIGKEKDGSGGEVDFFFERRLTAAVPE